VITVTVAFNYPIPFMAYGNIVVVNQMFSAKQLDEMGYTWWTNPSVFVSLPVYFVWKVLTTAAAVSLPLPCGLYLPMLAMGSTLGRLYGEILYAISPSFIPGAYALVSAAAFVSGATHTVSTAVIVFELTGQLTHMIPVLTGVLVARAVAPGMAVPLYDLLMSIKSLPYLAAAKLSLLYDRTVKDLLVEEPQFLTRESTYLDVYDILMATAGKASYEEIAIVDNESGILIGSASRRALVQAIDNYAILALTEAGKLRTDGGKKSSVVPASSADESGDSESAMESNNSNHSNAVLRKMERDAGQATTIRNNIGKMRHGASKVVVPFIYVV
jgi:hypothetical protein